MRLSTALLLVVLVAGVGAVAGGTYGLLETRSFVADAIQVEGVVVAIETRSFKPSWEIGLDGRLDWTQRAWRRTARVPVFEFRDRNSRVHRIIGEANSGSYAVGEKVPVLYSPRDPDHALIESAWVLWGTPAALGGLGLLIAAGSVFALVGPDRKRIDPPSLFQ